MQTASGRRLHKRVDEGEDESRDDRLIVRSLAIESARLGLRGKTDVVEFHRIHEEMSGGTIIPGKDGLWMPFPVEYKRGKPKTNNADAVQLCAQALCLEEMLGTTIPEGALFYGKIKRRTPIAFTTALRDETEQSANALHAMLTEGRTPPPVYHRRKCRYCSMKALCMPDIRQGERWKNYYREAVDETSS